MTLPVRSIANNPEIHDGRVVHLFGVLCLREDDFRIIQMGESSAIDETIFLPIDDPAALSKLREVCRTTPEPGWWLLEQGLVSARVRIGAAGGELHDVQSLYLPRAGSPVTIYLGDRP
jgi:hypothetical protein